MTAGQSGWEPRRCPYCGAEKNTLTYHLPRCDETPSTEAVVEAVEAEQR